MFNDLVREAAHGREQVLLQMIAMEDEMHLILLEHMRELPEPASFDAGRADGVSYAE